LYFANWGTHRLMLRVPRAQVDVHALKAFFVGRHAARATLAGQHVVLEFLSDPEEREDHQQPSLAALSALRAELMGGDLRCAYLAWLLAVQAGDLDDDAKEPPVPAGLGAPTAAQNAMIEFLGIDIDLLAAATRASVEPAESGDAFRSWVVNLPPAKKDEWLLRAVDAPELRLGDELLRAFRATAKPRSSTKRRKVLELLSLAEAERADREKADADRSRRRLAAAEKKRRKQTRKGETRSRACVGEARKSSALRATTTKRGSSRSL
jgi:hypothetical protein